MQSNRSLSGEVYKQSPLSKGKIANLVGKSSLINCTVNDVTAQAMWDTGAQKQYFKSYPVQRNKITSPGTLIQVLMTTTLKIIRNCKI